MRLFPIHAVLIAYGIALLADVFIFRNYTSLPEVAAYSLFANSFTVLTMVPFYLVLRLRAGELEPDMPSRVKTAMRSVALFAILAAITSYVLFSTWGSYLIAERMDLLAAKLEVSDLSAEDRALQMASAERFFSPLVQVLFMTLAVMFTGFVSSIVGAITVRPRGGQ